MALVGAPMPLVHERAASRSAVAMSGEMACPSRAALVLYRLRYPGALRYPPALRAAPSIDTFRAEGGKGEASQASKARVIVRHFHAKLSRELSA